MSDIDTGDTGHDAGYGDVDAGHEDASLAQGHQDFGNDNDHFNNLQEYGDSHSTEVDQHFDQGHQVNESNPGGEHYEESDYADGNLHAAESDTDFGVNSAEGDHSSSFGDLDQLRESFEGDTLHEQVGEEGGHGGLSVASN